MKQLGRFIIATNEYHINITSIRHQKSIIEWILVDFLEPPWKDKTHSNLCRTKIIAENIIWHKFLTMANTYLNNKQQNIYIYMSK